MKKLFAAAIIGFSMVVAGSALAAPKKVDRNSAEHKAWVENFKKKHDIKPKAAAKPKATKPAKKAPAKKAPAKKK